MKPWLLRLHRWATLIFALPWAVLLVTGLILSVEPMVMDPVASGRSVKLATVEAALAKFDAESKATTLAVRAYDGVLSLGAGRGVAPVVVDLATGERASGNAGRWQGVLSASRRLHESLMLDLKWLVDASTIAMLASMLLGLLMGWPQFRNTLGGWHRGLAWIALPLLILSPLTGLAIAYGINFTPPPVKVDSAPVKLAEAVRIVGAKYDMASVFWIRPMGGQMRARLYDGREARVFTVTPQGLVANAQSWPRALHEGVWAGVWSGLINVVTSLALIALMVTGLWIWTRRNLKMRARRRAKELAAA